MAFVGFLAERTLPDFRFLGAFGLKLKPPKSVTLAQSNLRFVP
jgi:hypothetical protein